MDAENDLVSQVGRLLDEPMGVTGGKVECRSQRTSLCTSSEGGRR